MVQTFSDDGILWMADTTSSSFFSFDPSALKNLFNMLLLILCLSTYGNQTGIVKSPISRPYWIESDDQGELVFQ